MALDDDTVRLARGGNLATVVTLMPDGRPQAQLTWIDTDGEHLLVNTEPQRQRSKNLARDPRITVLIHSGGNAFDWSEVRGRVTNTVAGQPAHDHLEKLSQRYTGGPYQLPIGPDGRVILEITPDKINTPRSLGMI